MRQLQARSELPALTGHDRRCSVLSRIARTMVSAIPAERHAARHTHGPPAIECLLDLEYKTLSIVETVGQAGDDAGQLQVFAFELDWQSFSQTMPRAFG